MSSDAARTLRFRDCELDLAAFVLRRSGRIVRMERQPMDLLIYLIEHRDRLVTRAEIVDRLWGKDVFVDVETGIHTAVRKIRQALKDSPDAPVFLETVPGRGYRFVAAVEADTVRRPVMLAVLPFVDSSGDESRRYIGEGLADEMAVSLGQIDPGRLRVLARSATRAYSGTSKTGAVIGRELGVDYLLEGSVRTEAQLLRVTPSLIRVSDQVQIWSQSFDREVTSLLGLQRELSLAIADQIRVRLTPDQIGAMARREARNAEAYDLYLRGRNFESRRTPATNRQAIDYYARAAALDPDYAAAWAGIAMVLSASVLNGDASPAAVTPRAAEAAANAMRANPSAAEAHQVVAYLKWFSEWDWPAAESGMRRASEIDPGNAIILLQHGHILSQLGRHAEAAAATQRAREADPLFAMGAALSSQIAFQAGDFTNALAFADRAIVLDPELWIGHMMRGQALERFGRYEPSLESLATAARLSWQNSKPMSLRGYILATMGRGDEARTLLRALEEAAVTRYVPPVAMALVNAGLGDRDAVEHWLARAFDVRDFHLMYVPVDAKWEPYRSSPKVRSLLVRAGFVTA